MTLRTEILTLFADPTNAYVALLAGGMLVLSEFLRPGRVLPGVFGAVLCIVGLHALLQWQWSTSGTALLLGSSIFATSSLAAKYAATHFVCAICCFLGSLLLVEDPQGIHPVAALAASTFAFTCSWLLGVARHARRAKFSQLSPLENIASRNMSV
jgi:membrane-bound ClpP family serine protease